MKKMIAGLVFFFSLSLIQATYTEQLPDNDMYLFIHHEEALGELEATCGQSMFAKSLATSQAVNTSIKKKIDMLSPVEQFLYAHDLYQKISSIYSLVSTMDSDKKCYYTYIFTSLQGELRKHNIGIMKNNKVLSDFANIEEEDGDKSIADKFRLTFIEHYNQKYHNATNKFPSAMRITANEVQTNDLAEKRLAEPLMELTTNMVYSTINDLYTKKFITKTEVDAMVAKMQINYKANTCSSYHGRFSIQYALQDGKKHNATIDKVEINVNGCYNIFILGELEERLENLILHEIGGHMGHYIKDTERETFQSICWESKEERNTACSERDFVSTYASTNSYEDYAETFTYRWLNNIPHKTAVIDKKTQYMDNMLQRIKNNNE